MQISLQPKQKEAWINISNYPVYGYGGAKGGGKSRFMRDWKMARRLKYPNSRGMTIRKTLDDLEGSHIIKLREERPEIMKYYSKQDKTIYYPNGSTEIFRYLDHKDDVYRYQGREFDDIGIDEAGQHSQEVIEVLRTSIRTTNPLIKPKLLLTFNPGGPGHAYLKRIFVDKVYEQNEDPSDYGFTFAQVYDNKKLLEADPNYLKTLMALPPKRRAMYLDGDWNAFEGAFFEEWSTAQHVIEPKYDLKDIPENYDLYLSMDDGFNAPRSIHLSAQDNDGFVETIWEFYEKTGHKTDLVHAAENVRSNLQKLGILDIVNERAIFIYDPSMDTKNSQTSRSSSDVFVDVLSKDGTKMRKQPGINDRAEGARNMRTFLQWSNYNAPMWRIWSTCTQAIRTLPTLVYDEHKEDDIDTTGEDHAYDELRYMLMGLKRQPSRMTMREPVVIYRDEDERETSTRSKYDHGFYIDDLSD